MNASDFGFSIDGQLPEPRTVHPATLGTMRAAIADLERENVRLRAALIGMLVYHAGKNWQGAELDPETSSGSAAIAARDALARKVQP